jgi:hypothetical protein
MGNQRFTPVCVIRDFCGDQSTLHCGIYVSRDYKNVRLFSKKYVLEAPHDLGGRQSMRPEPTLKKTSGCGRFRSEKNASDIAAS